MGIILLVCRDTRIQKLNKNVVPHVFPWTPAVTPVKRARVNRGKEKARKMKLKPELAWWSVGVNVDVEGVSES